MFLLAVLDVRSFSHVNGNHDKLTGGVVACAWANVGWNEGSRPGE